MKYKVKKIIVCLPVAEGHDIVVDYMDEVAAPILVVVAEIVYESALVKKFHYSEVVRFPVADKDHMDFDLDNDVEVQFAATVVEVMVVIVKENLMWALDLVACFPLGHFGNYLVMALVGLVVVEANHIAEVVLDPSFLCNVHMDPFAVDLDRVDA
jgi:hypothetical protein